MRILRDIPDDVESKKEIVGKAGLVASATWVNRAVVFATSVIVVRVLGPELYGAYTLGRRLFILFALFALFGLDSALVRFVPGLRRTGEEDKLRKTLDTAFALGLGISLLIAAVAAGTAGFVERTFGIPSLGTVLIAFALTLPLDVFLGLSGGFFQGERKLGLQALIQSIIPAAVKLAVVACLSLLGYKLFAVLAGVWLASFAATLVAHRLLRTRFGYHPLRSYRGTDGRTARRLFGFSSVIVGIYGLSEAMNNLDVYLVGLFLPAAQVGIYGVVLETSLLFRVVLDSFDGIFAPLISGAWEKGETERISGLYKFEARMILTVVAPFFFLLCLFPEQILSIFGPEFLEGKAALIIFSLGQLVNGATGGVGFVLTMTGKQGFQFANMTAGFFLNAVLCLVWIPKMGVQGAALAAAAALIAVNLLCVVEVKRLYGFTFLHRNTWKPLAAAGFVFVLFKLFFPDFSGFFFLFPAGLLFLLAYGSVLWVLGLGREEVSILRAFLRGRLPQPPN